MLDAPAYLTPIFTDHCAHPLLQLSQHPDDRAAGESPAHYAQRIQSMERTCGSCELRRRSPGRSGSDTVLQVGDLLLTKELLNAADIGTKQPSVGQSLRSDRVP